MTRERCVGDSCCDLDVVDGVGGPRLCLLVSRHKLVASARSCSVECGSGRHDSGCGGRSVEGGHSFRESKMAKAMNWRVKWIN